MVSAAWFFLSLNFVYSVLNWRDVELFVFTFSNIFIICFSLENKALEKQAQLQMHKY